MSVKFGGLKSINMGYYLPPKSYLRPKPKVNTTQRIVAFTAAGLTLIAAGFIFTALTFTEPKESIAASPVANQNDAGIVQPPLTNNNSVTSDNIKLVTGELLFPVQLAYFKVVKDIHSLDLKWSTTIEYKNEFFTIEKSNNGTDFHEIGCVESRKSHELSNDYTFTDYNLSDGVVFYRLRQTSANEKSTFIALEKVIINDVNEDMSLYIENIGPQPFSSYFTINYFSDRKSGISVELFDKSGKKIYKSYTEASQGYNSCRFIEGNKLTDDEYTVRIANSSAASVKRVKKNA
jgi:hypothetical protein